jgi:putative RNA 2'-phosphotransferase
MNASWNTALQVGQRYGKPVIQIVAAGQMFCDGYPFFKSENNVWLTENVPVKYLSEDELQQN